MHSITRKTVEFYHWKLVKPLSRNSLKLPLTVESLDISVNCVYCMSPEASVTMHDCLKEVIIDLQPHEDHTERNKRCIYIGKL